LGIHGEVNWALLMWVELTMQTTGNSYGSQMQRQKYVKQSRSPESQKWRVLDGAVTGGVIDFEA
jgi:hypothetical protein